MAARALEVVITGDAKGALTAMGDIETKSGGLGSALTGLGTIAVAGFAVVGAAIVGAGVELINLGGQFDDAADKIRVSTGATGAVLDQLKGSFNAVLSDTPAEMDDVSTAIAGINQKLDLTGAPLEDLARQLLDLSHITGTDLKANMEGATSLFQNWGVATEYQSGVLDLLFRTMQESGAPVSVLSDALAENGVVLRELGFTIPESAALFGTLAKAGLDASDVMPAFSKSMATAAREGVSAGDLLGQTFDRIKNSPNDIAASQAALEVFGAKAGPKLAAMIREGTLSFADMQAQIEGSSDTIGQAASDTKDWGEKWTIFKNQLMIALEPAATSLFDGLGAAMDGLMPQVEKLTQWFEDNPDAMANFAQSVQGAVQWIIDNVPVAIDKITTWWGNFQRGIEVIQQFWTDHEQTIRTVVGFLVDVVQTWVQALSDAWLLINNVLGWIVTAWNWVWNAVETVVNWFTGTAYPAIAGFVQSIADKFTYWKTFAIEVWDSVWGRIEEFVSQVQNLPGRIADVLYNMWEGLKDGFKAAINWIIDKWNNLTFTTPDAPGTDWGGQTFRTPHIDRLHTGGTFRAPTAGGEGLALLRDGERVSTPGSSGTAVYVSVNPVTGEVMAQELTSHQRRGGQTPWTRVA